MSRIRSYIPDFDSPQHIRGPTHRLSLPTTSHLQKMLLLQPSQLCEISTIRPQLTGMKSKTQIPTMADLFADFFPSRRRNLRQKAVPNQPFSSLYLIHARKVARLETLLRKDSIFSTIMLRRIWVFRPLFLSQSMGF